MQSCTELTHVCMLCFTHVPKWNVCGHMCVPVNVYIIVCVCLDYKYHATDS